jgi:hypothetical protein
MQWDMLRLLDFYYLFPHLLKDVSLPSKLLGQKRYFANQTSKYNRVPAPRLFLRQIEGLQEIAIRSLASKGFIKSDELERGLVVRTDRELPAELMLADKDELPDDQRLLDFVAVGLAEVPLAGENGLKARTGLLEHRYDPD